MNNSQMMDNHSKISALAWAAHKKGVSYGVFVANLTPAKRDKVYYAYTRKKWTEHNRRLKEKGKSIKSPEYIPALAERGCLLPPTPAKKGGRTYSFDTDAAFQLYCEGHTDREIGQELGMSTSAICNWRRQAGIPSQKEERLKRRRKKEEQQNNE